MSPFRRRMIEDMQIRNLTPNTQRVYVAQVVRFAGHFRKSPDLLGPDEIRTYLVHLIQERRLAASSIIVAVSAPRFIYTVTLERPWVVEDDIPTGRQAKKLPVVLSQSEIARFLGAVDNQKHRVILTLCYATGLRISEAVRLKAAAEFHRLADVPPEVEWFANLSNAHTRRVYENAVKDFMLFTGIVRPEEFRTVTRAHIIAWHDQLARRGLGVTCPLVNQSESV